MHYYCDEKKYLNGLIARFDNLIDKESECEVIKEINISNSNLSSRDLYLNETSIVEVDRAFFIWLGTLTDSAIEYIDIWCSSKSTFSSICLYYDSEYILFNKLREVMNLVYGYDEDNEKSIDIINHQNDFFRKIKVLMRSGKSFDHSLILLASHASLPFSLTLENIRKKTIDRLNTLNGRIEVIDIATRKDLFFKRIYHDAYCLELILRGNAAAASDIIRMLVLYLDGGMYIDVDTLPSLEKIFGKIPNNVNANVVNIVRSEYYLRTLRSMKGIEHAQNDISALESFLGPVVIDTIKEKLSNTSSLSLDIVKPVVYKNFIAMAAFNNMYEYNNNVLAACKGSRTVRIILREMAKRYKHLFRRRYHNGKMGDFVDKSSLSRLSNYRNDGILALENNVTLCLTGPSLILEVILGIVYEILEIDKSTSPLAISYALNSRIFRFSYFNHTNYTPEHVRSSWL